MTSSDHRKAQDALNQAKQQQHDIEQQAPEVAAEAGVLGMLLDRNHLAPRMRKAMKLRLRWGQ